MLNTQEVVAFVPTADASKARSFYERIIGLRVISEDRFALVLDANGTMLRVTNVQNFKPQQFTIIPGSGVNLTLSAQKWPEIRHSFRKRLQQSIDFQNGQP